jgi:hypothetical protein
MDSKFDNVEGGTNDEEFATRSEDDGDHATVS